MEESGFDPCALYNCPLSSCSEGKQIKLNCDVFIKYDFNYI